MLGLENHVNKAHALSSLRERILKLGKEHYPSELTFPIDYLIPYLETKSQEYSSPEFSDFGRFWLCRTMLEIGVPHRALFMLYNGLFERVVSFSESIEP